jgi:hypothetical protein
VRKVLAQCIILELESAGEAGLGNDDSTNPLKHQEVKS